MGAHTPSLSLTPSRVTMPGRSMALATFSQCLRSRLRYMGRPGYHVNDDVQM